MRERVQRHLIDNSTDPGIDRWLRSREPRIELAVRYCLLGQFQKAKANPAFNRRVDELINLLKPDKDELAAILRHSREIGQAINGPIDAQKIEAQIAAVKRSTGRRQEQDDLERFEERIKKIAKQAGKVKR